MVESWRLYKEPETNADVACYMTPSVTLGLHHQEGICPVWAHAPLDLEAQQISFLYKVIQL